MIYKFNNLATIILSSFLMQILYTENIVYRMDEITMIYMHIYIYIAFNFLYLENFLLNSFKILF